ncbi:hypothetical protein F9L16_17270 [Agarivorans sp. B2Z047]|uniref:DUF4870 family protein n=1 Tax=Agarivorans sp. B2Z047 TaxID=2652721 RepID=UPI00128B27F0|nr:hypothetical protein [Agarivorans sp. B2Z047]MPW30739.1 hypothetical protein [Agarivorans sp. B2Z047]UQN42039.1 hypothetical protein LQZ07_20065 [Agarivorans sp. B2Z047]
MSEIQNAVTEAPLSASDEAAKTSALIGYGLMILGLFTGLFWLVGAIWAMVKKADAAGTLFEDHYSNIIKTFWWGFGLSIIGFVLAFVIVGYFVLLGVWIWSIYRIIKGLAKITSNKSYY